MSSSTQADLSAVATTAERAAPGRDDRDQAHGPRRWENASLLWRVFAANVIVFVAAFALLAWAPVTVHRVATPSELVILSVGLILMLAVDLVLLRRAFGPLRRLAAVMGAVDPGQPGRRAEPSTARDAR